MPIKVLCFCLLLSKMAVSQDESFLTNGKFRFTDTLSVAVNYSVNPGQISKDGKAYYLGLYYDGDDDTTFSAIYRLSLSPASDNPLSRIPAAVKLTPPAGYLEVFQCSATADEKTLVFVVNNFNGWAGNDLAIAEKNENGIYVSRMLDELSAIDTADAYPWISPDGLSIYFVRDEKMYYAKRNNRSDKFNKPLPVPFAGDVQTPVVSVWLSNNEKKIFYISANTIYVAERKKSDQPFKLPVVFTNEFKEFEFIASQSFSPDMKDLYLYYSGETTKILHYKLK